VEAWDEATFQLWYGRWAPLAPPEVASLLRGCDIRWWIVGGRAARVGAAARRHEDTDIAFRRADLPALRAHLRDWHLWQNNSGWLHPLLPGDDLHPECEQIWLRRDANHPWVADFQVDRSTQEWIFKRDPRIRLSWDRVLHEVDDLWYLRPEVALLHKAHLDRPQDRADLTAAALTDDARLWLASTLELLGHHDWATIVRS
jgi:hypothetical protein